ncbi:MAG: hypothetical protein Q8R57_04105 [Bacteroidota bacterium]|nr:hypothetical protein [Bacteroidota bacterium]
MPHISRKKNIYSIGLNLRQYLKKYGRETDVPIYYPDLKLYRESISHYDSKGKDTLWETCIYAPEEQERIYKSLLEIYALLRVGGDIHVVDHLVVDRIDVCLYGNTLPFRIRVVNKLNDNFDYFYVKNADASRVYGLELEHLLSPNRISYLVSGNTLIEEHIAGIPGDEFIKRYMQSSEFNGTRVAKEFVKFNERCLIRLLGDMHSSNFVVQIMPDFEETNYRIRAIDFDQQSFESRKNVYLPQFYKQNTAFLNLVQDKISTESLLQYQREERNMMKSRMRAAKWPLFNLLKAMKHDEIAPKENVENLKKELAKHYQSKRFLRAKTMGDLVKASLLELLKN